MKLANAELRFTEAQLEQAFIELLEKEEMLYRTGANVRDEDVVVQEPHANCSTANSEVLIKTDLKTFLQKKYDSDGITNAEVNSIIRDLEKLPASDL